MRSSASRWKAIIPLTLVVATVGACATATTPARVTRFHLGPAIAPGSVALTGSPGSLERGAFESAVGRELARLGFAPANAVANARYTYSVELRRDAVRGSARSPVSVGVGVGGGSYGGGFGGGLGVGTSFGLGRQSRNVATLLGVRLIDRATNTAVWEGRAETVTSDRNDPAMTADRLARALFADFPGQSGRTITVR